MLKNVSKKAKKEDIRRMFRDLGFKNIDLVDIAIIMKTGEFKNLL
jgi:hypothetical protein